MVSSVLNFSINLRRLRMMRGLTQEQLAERAQTGYKYLQRIEGGVIEGLHFSTLDKFANVLGVEPAELVAKPVHPVRVRRLASLPGAKSRKKRH